MGTTGGSATERLGDAERGRAIQILNEHWKEGRLDPSEHEARTTKAHGAILRQDLDQLFTDLPARSPTWGVVEPASPVTRTDVDLRPGRPADAAELSALALRSKGHWGYDADFLEACRSELAIGLERAVDTVVAEVDGVVSGFHLLAADPQPPAGVGELRMLFVDPHHIGSGVGSVLLADATRAAALRRWTSIRIESDPGAEGFYLHHGAWKVGEVASGSIPGRILPLLELSCP